MMLFVTGCTSDPREPKVTHTLGLLDQTTAKVSALGDAIDSAIKKAEETPDKGIVLKEAISRCDELKVLCQKGLQPTAHEIQLLQRTTTDEEKQKLKEQFQSQIESSITRLNDKRLALQKKIEKLKKLSEEEAYAGSKDQVDAFITKNYAETVAEYNSLNRQLRNERA